MNFLYIYYKILDDFTTFYRLNLIYFSLLSIGFYWVLTRFYYSEHFEQS